MKCQFLFLLFLWSGLCAAQRDNCCKSDEFVIDEVYISKPLNGLGNCKFPIASKIDSVQFYVNQGFNLYHNFNFAQAYWSFNKVMALDSNVLAAYIGKELIREEFGHDYDDYFLLKAYKILLIDSIPTSKLEAHLGELFFRPYFEKTKDKVFESSVLKEMVADLPDLPEAQTWYLKYHIDAYDHSVANSRKLDSIADTLIIKYPYYTPILHQVIHLWEDWRSEKTMAYTYLDSLAPKSGHLVHMPAHIYFYNGLYTKAEASFYKSYRIDSAFNASNTKRVKHNWNIVHNLEFLNVNCTELGKISDADSVQKMIEKRLSKLDESFNVTKNLSFKNKLYTLWRTNQIEESIELCTATIKTHLNKHRIS